MSSSVNGTLYRIQKEISETLKREEELKSGHLKTDGSLSIENDDGAIKEIPKSDQNIPKSNGFGRRFIPNTNARGIMQKFFKSRGKVSVFRKTSEPQSGWCSDAFEPVKVPLENGKQLRNGYIPAEEKIVKELHDFQFREAELRSERRKSQPELMAALKLEESELEESEFEWKSCTDGKECLKPSKSLANLYQPEEEDFPSCNSAPCSLKPARSLAALCDLSDDELDMPGTHSLIMQFEGLKMKEDCV